MIKINGQHPIDHWADKLKQERARNKTARKIGTAERHAIATLMMDTIMTKRYGDPYPMKMEEMAELMVLPEYDLATLFVRACYNGPEMAIEYP